MRDFVEAVHTARNLRFLRVELPTLGVVSFGASDSRELIYVIQLCVLSTFLAHWMELFRSCLRSRPLSGNDSFMLQRFHFNMNLLNLMQDEVISLVLSGGHEYSSFGLER